MASKTNELGNILATQLNCVYGIRFLNEKQKFGANQIKAILMPMNFNPNDKATRCQSRHTIQYAIVIESLRQNAQQHFELVQNLIINSGKINNLVVGDLVYRTKNPPQNVSIIDWEKIKATNIISSQIVLTMETK